MWIWSICLQLSIFFFIWGYRSWSSTRAPACTRVTVTHHSPWSISTSVFFTNDISISVISRFNCIDRCQENETYLCHAIFIGWYVHHIQQLINTIKIIKRAVGSIRFGAISSQKAGRKIMENYFIYLWMPFTRMRKGLNMWNVLCIQIYLPPVMQKSELSSICVISILGQFFVSYTACSFVIDQDWFMWFYLFFLFYFYF